MRGESNGGLAGFLDDLDARRPTPPGFVMASGAPSREAALAD
jgi:hypothetical protein